tara:strand:- start:2805 stop:3500 length:696 start_codon:yes stop_codon:yes gene_type:complete
MENEFSIREKNSLKSFLIFAFLLLVLLFIGFSINSSYFKVKSIEINNISSNYNITDFYIETLNKSIWLINGDTFLNNRVKYPTIENVTVAKEYPDKIILNITEYEELIVVTDLRGTIPRRTILYKNGLEIVSADINNLPTISILNGPVQSGFNGELISMMMTLKNYELDLSTFAFNYDGQNIVGEYRETTIDFGPSIDLGIKAAALGSLLENSNCSGKIKFIGSEELIANC